MQRRNAPCSPGRTGATLLAHLQSLSDASTLAGLQEACAGVHVGDRILDYVQALLAASRSMSGVAQGLSPRSGIGLLAAARAWALIAGRDHVRPEDVQAVLPTVAGHRLHAGGGLHGADALVRRLIEAVPLS